MTDLLAARIQMAVSLGFVAFLEAIFLGMYLYGWDRVGPRTHLAAGAVVAVTARPRRSSSSR